MQTITDTFASEHSHCDKLFAELEAQVASKQWNLAPQEFTDFIAAMERHFSREEGVLFPTFEKLTGQTMGPTQVMRMEHTQMRQVFSVMQTAVERRDSEDFLGHSETLLMLMRQHNAKEEQILYPMVDQVLADQVPQLLEQMKSC